MKYFLVIGALLAAPLLATTPAAAQMQAPFNESATATSFAPSAPSMLGEGASWDGSVSGLPMSGSIHVDESRNAGGSMQAQFTLSDGGGSTITGSLSGTFSADANGSSATGSFVISGGTGAFVGASGSGSFSESMSGGAPMTLSLSGVLAGPGPSYPYAPASVYAPLNPPVVYSPATNVYYQNSPYPATYPYGTTASSDASSVPNAPMYPQYPAPAAASQPAITGQQSTQGCHGISGDGKAYSITGQSC